MMTEQLSRAGARLAIAALLHGVFPGLTCDLMAVANRLLPSPEGGSMESATGHECASRWTESWLGKGNREAAERYNQT